MVMLSTNVSHNDQWKLKIVNSQNSSQIEIFELTKAIVSIMNICWRLYVLVETDNYQTWMNKKQGNSFFLHNSFQLIVKTLSFYVNIWAKNYDQ